jgi:hypothetical protein
MVEPAGCSSENAFWAITAATPVLLMSSELEQGLGLGAQGLAL